VDNFDLQNLDSLEFLFWKVWKFHRVSQKFRSFRLKRIGFYENFAKLKRRLRSHRLKRFEVYASFTKLSTLIKILQCAIQTLRVYASAKLSARKRSFTVWRSWMRSFRLQGFEVVAYTADFSTLIRNFAVWNSYMALLRELFALVRDLLSLAKSAMHSGTFFRLKLFEVYANSEKLSTLMRNPISTMWLATSTILSKKSLWDRPRRAGIGRLTGIEVKQSSVD